jgi:hypothetical protein
VSKPAGGCMVMLMPNHYHCLLDTPTGNLVAGMRRLQHTSARRYNGRALYRRCQPSGMTMNAPCSWIAKVEKCDHARIDPSANGFGAEKDSNQRRKTKDRKRPEDRELDAVRTPRIAMLARGFVTAYSLSHEHHFSQ